MAERGSVVAGCRLRGGRFELTEDKAPEAVESVWNYPRPPRLERTERRLTVEHRGVKLAETVRGMRVLETSHPPVYYLPPADVAMGLIEPSARRGSFCEFKGLAAYWNLRMADGTVVPGVAWSYPEPSKAFRGLRDYLAFYASKVEVCTVDGERGAGAGGGFLWRVDYVVGEGAVQGGAGDDGVVRGSGRSGGSVSLLSGPARTA